MATTTASKPKTLLSPVAALLQITRPLQLVDIGANPLEGPAPYNDLLSQGLVEVIGFEPQPEALAELNKIKGPHERYLPYAVGDGDSHTLHICQVSGMTSLLEPDPVQLAAFNLFEKFGTVTSTMTIPTQRLDDIEEIDHVDFLKIDIQGSELSVFQNGRNTLAQAIAVQTEMSFITLYKDQPPLGEVDRELRSQGFVPHGFDQVKKWLISPCVINDNPRKGLNQLLECDLIYVRDFARLDLLSTEQVKYLAFFAHHYCASFDLALRCIVHLQDTGMLPLTAAASYAQLLAD